MADFSIIIPHRGNALGLWATIHSCEEDLLGLDFDYNYVIVTNGEKLDADALNTIHYLESSKRLLAHVHSDVALSPPAARQRGASVADGNLLCFFDNHCLVGKRYFERVVADFEGRPLDMLHSTTKFYSSQGAHYHYTLKLDYNFWAESSQFPQKEFTMYPLAAGGHGGFVVRKTAWDEVGGYGPEELLQGYGGEELLFDLKMWRLGKTNHIDPRLIHYHYAGNRGYSRHYTDEYYLNLLTSANVIGGEQWLYRLFDSFLNGKHLRLNPGASMYELMETAYNRSATYAKRLDAKSVRTLDESLVYFKEQRIAM